MTETPIIEFQQVSLGYGGRTIVRDVSLSLFPNDFLGIVVPNGSGKTTVLRALLGTLSPRKGEIRRAAANGVPPTIGYVPQRDSLELVLPLTVRDVVMMGRYASVRPLRRFTAADRRIADEAMAHVDIGNLAGLSYRDLSGGQRQRTLIARALAAQPDILVLDEPTNGMDLSSRTAILEIIRHLHEHDGLTVVMVTHLLSDVANYVNRIALVEQGTVRLGAVDEILSSDRLSAIYQMPVHVSEVHGVTVIVPEPDDE